jgi:protein phosphatase
VLQLDIAGRTDRGFERRENEDNFLTASLGRGLRIHQTSLDRATVTGPAVEGDAQLVVVADGMGGMRLGAVASTVAVDTIAGHLGAGLPQSIGRRGIDAPAIRATLETAFDRAHAAVVNAGRPVGAMGTTATVALIAGSDLWIAHVGDSRAYLLRGSRLEQLTVDHTMAQQLAELGVVPHAAGLENVLWKAVGAPADMLHCQPDVGSFELLPGDVLLLCSDGLGKHVQDDELRAVLSCPESSRVLCDRLVDTALARGGCDNVTVVVARTASSGLHPARASHEGN